MNTSNIYNPCILVLLGIETVLITQGRLHTHFFVVLFEGGKVLTRLAKFTLLHTFTDIPVHKGALRVEQVKLAIKAAPRR